MATEVAPGVDIGKSKMWAYNTTRKLFKAKAWFESMYRSMPLDLLTFSIDYCNKEIWDYEEDASLNQVHYFFNCNDVILQVTLDSKVERKILAKRRIFFEFSHDAEDYEKAVVQESKANLLRQKKLGLLKREKPGETRFKILFNPRLLAYYGYEFSLSGAEAYKICQVEVGESTIYVSDECRSGEYTYKFGISLVEPDDLEFFWVKNRADYNLSPTEFITALYNNSSKIDRRIDSILITLRNIGRLIVKSYLPVNF
jgi:septum formation inhibitor MinC